MTFIADQQGGRGHRPQRRTFTSEPDALAWADNQTRQTGQPVVVWELDDATFEGDQ